VTDEDGHRELEYGTDEWEHDHQDAGSICAFSKNKDGVIVEGEAS